MKLSILGKGLLATDLFQVASRDTSVFSVARIHVTSPDQFAKHVELENPDVIIMASRPPGLNMQMVVDYSVSEGLPLVSGIKGLDDADKRMLAKTAGRSYPVILPYADKSFVEMVQTLSSKLCEKSARHYDLVIEGNYCSARDSQEPESLSVISELVQEKAPALKSIVRISLVKDDDPESEFLCVRCAWKEKAPPHSSGFFPLVASMSNLSHAQGLLAAAKQLHETPVRALSARLSLLTLAPHP